METNEIEKLADEWIEARTTHGSLENSVLDWELPFSNPEVCLKVIVRVLEKIDTTTDNDIFGILAAGPLEDLLTENGEAVVDRVETLARRNPEFRKLLNGIYDSDVKETVKSKLSRYMEKR